MPQVTCTSPCTSFLGQLHCLLTPVPVLQDPSVAASPLEKRIAFLRSKNLTQDEIDAALRRVNESPAAISNALTVTSPYSSPPPPYTSSYYAPQQQQTAPLWVLLFC